MKNRLFISLGLFIFSIAISAYSSFYIVRATNEVTNAIVSIQGQMSNGNYTEALNESRNINLFWKKSHNMLEIFIHHEALENIDQSLSIIDKAIEKKQWNDFWPEAARVISQVENLHDSENLSLGNIL